MKRERITVEELLRRYAALERDFSGVDIRYREEGLSRCNLCGINLSNSRFNFAYLIETDLSNADLSGARMAEMTLDRAI